MMTTNQDQRPRRVEDTEVRQTSGGAVLRRGVESVEELHLNPTAFALWELCDGHTTVAEMVDAVCDLFAVVPEQADRDVTSAIQRLRTAGVLR